jgi:hypothetical protein
VNLIQVDVVGLQAAEAVFQSAAHVITVDGKRTVAQPSEGAPLTCDLGRHNHAVAISTRQPLADNRLGAALRFSASRHRVHLRGVDEIDAALERQVELLFGIGERVLLTEGHRS